jgi:hypothetical protein
MRTKKAKRPAWLPKGGAAVILTPLPDRSGIALSVYADGLPGQDGQNPSPVASAALAAGQLALDVVARLWHDGAEDDPDVPYRTAPPCADCGAIHPDGCPSCGRQLPQSLDGSVAPCICGFRAISSSLN